MEAMLTNETREYSDSEARWQAVLARDRRADGAFYCAVRSTGVYCRPSCPSRRPLRKNVEFFDSTRAAESAGYRACRRCDPESLSVQQRLVAAVVRLIESAEELPTLARLAAETGVSAAHLQKTFKRATGFSPRQYAASLRAARFRERLRKAGTVTAAVYDAGFGSTRAAYEGAGRALAMRPSVYRLGGRGERITYAHGPGPAGPILVAATARGICAIYLGQGDELVSRLSAEFPNAVIEHDTEGMREHLASVARAMSASRAGGVALDAMGTAFQNRVWEAIRSIPRGETRTYSQIAELIGQPSAARAVARACAANPLALLIPCHRVVRSDGAPGGYRWGIEVKRALLKHEGALE
jgi:AraC family transcriptional regulator of adaptative response/methylated-DNA-[protein]-cysteine methyltransferase